METKYSALTKCFLDALDRYANPRAQIYRAGNGWESISAEEMLRRVAGLARALGELGIRAGDRVAIFAPNCPEWHIADFAIQGLGAVSVPVYFHESTDRLTYILEDSGARVVVTAGEAQARRIAEFRERLPALEHVICVAPPVDLPGDFLRYETLIAAAGDADVTQYRRGVMEVTPDQLATIIYTSGTTGEPKGVMLTQLNLSSNALDSSRDFGNQPSDIGLSFLPLAHVYGRVMDYGYFLRGASVAYVEQMETVAQALREVRPMVLAAVPRFYEKTYANIIEQGHRETGLRRKIFDQALRVAAEAVPWRAYGRKVSFGVKLRWHVANRVVFSKIRAGMGGRIRALSSGGAPLAPELAEFFWSVDLPVYQGYGLTETSPVVTTNTPLASKVGTVGRPIANVEVRIAEDGEILVKGLCVMRGYYRKPQDTREVLTPEGWFSTGDIGRIDEDGYLVITDRKKELLKTAGGKFVAPAPIENLLKTSQYIDNAMVVGDKRKFVSVLIVPDFTAIEAAGRAAGQEFATRAQVAASPWLRDLLAGEIERLTEPLAQYEKPKRFAVLDQDFTFANGEATYTLKLKRRVIEERYQDVIARLYADVEEPRPQRRA
ncbi:MAG: long-chain fatty acid--CoA ligase [Acidobacteriia bacterium]|nr:long-chain fatty acid--CoA ligase [Terriglobia bacterium]